MGDCELEPGSQQNGGSGLRGSDKGKKHVGKKLLLSVDWWMVVVA